MQNLTTHQRTNSRCGFSLMEVILATAMLMGSVVVLARLVNMGRTQAVRAAEYAEAHQLCEATLNEIVLGLRSAEPADAVPLTPVEVLEQSNGDTLLSEQDPFSDQDALGRPVSSRSSWSTTPNWVYSVRTASLPDTPELMALTVQVRQADENLARPRRYQLTRWIRSDRSKVDNTSDRFTGDRRNALR